MKKSLLFFVLSLSYTLLQAQTARLVLVEEFTSGTCPPSALRDPVLDSLLWNNPNKVIGLKYQGPPWPSADPMYTQNPTEVLNRDNYYSASYVPYGLVDGSVAGFSNPNVIDITQTVIDNRAAVMSPFALQVTDSLSQMNDSIFIKVTITCTQDVVMTTPKLQVALTEKHIHYSAPPAGMVMTDFYNVMRKMVPGSGGTSLAASWTNGQVQTFHFGIPVPAYIYNISELFVIAWIQDDNTKEVMQAGFCAPLPWSQSVDIGVIDISGINNTNCIASHDPIVTIKNYGYNTVTSANIHYSTDGINYSVYPWTGSLVSGDSVQLTLPTIYTSAITCIEFNAYTGEPNSVGDWVNSNNSYTEYFYTSNPDSAIDLITENFENILFPPHNWSIQNPDLSLTWKRIVPYSGYGIGTASATLPFYDIAAGNIDYLYLPELDLSNASAPIYLFFDLAHSRYNTNDNDVLMVEASSNCGSTWNTLYNKSGTALSTAPDYTATFHPNASQWRTDSVNLMSYIGESEVMLRFKGISDYGNNLYIDNVNLSFPGIGIENNTNEEQILYYPNPVLDHLIFDFTNTNLQNAELDLYNELGEKSRAIYIQDKIMIVQRENLPAGIYLFQIIQEGKVIKSGKLIFQ